MTWNCPDWVKVPLTLVMASMRAMSARFGSLRTKRRRVTQWVMALMLSLPPTASSNRAASCWNLDMQISFFSGWYGKTDLPDYSRCRRKTGTAARHDSDRCPNPSSGINTGFCRYRVLWLSTSYMANLCHAASISARRVVRFYRCAGCLPFPSHLLSRLATSQTMNVSAWALVSLLRPNPASAVRDATHPVVCLRILDPARYEGVFQE